MDNSDSPSIVDQLSQGPSLFTIPLLVIVSQLLTYPMPYALFLASCNMGSLCSWFFLDHMFPSPLLSFVPCPHCCSLSVCPWGSVASLFI